MRCPTRPSRSTPCPAIPSGATCCASTSPARSASTRSVRISPCAAAARCSTGASPTIGLGNATSWCAPLLPPGSMPRSAISSTPTVGAGAGRCSTRGAAPMTCSKWASRPIGLTTWWRSTPVRSWRPSSTARSMPPGRSPKFWPAAANPSTSRRRLPMPGSTSMFAAPGRCRRPRWHGLRKPRTRTAWHASPGTANWWRSAPCRRCGWGGQAWRCRRARSCRRLPPARRRWRISPAPAPAVPAPSPTCLPEWVRLRCASRRAPASRRWTATRLRSPH